ncbi:unnamed protein product [Prunus armeniaca]
MVHLDVCTRWNSTYMMLESALKLQKGFHRMEEDDPTFLGYFEEYEAHEFYDDTLRFSASKSVSSNAPLHEVYSFLEEIDTMMNVDDVVMCELATMMKRKLQKFLKSRKDKDVVEIRNEIDKYLFEPPVNLSNEEFKLLDWWKKNATKFPILSKVAKDVFAVQALTVASECAFSMGKRVVYPFRSTLTPKIVDALICCSDWLRVEEFIYYKELILDELDFYRALEKMKKDVLI